MVGSPHPNNPHVLFILMCHLMESLRNSILRKNHLEMKSTPTILYNNPDYIQCCLNSCVLPIGLYSILNPASVAIEASD